ncbi:MAG: MXAN_6640 family putative metalloprotease, partial [bacterium]
MRKGLVVLNMVFYMITAAILMIQVPYSIAKEEICPTLLNQMISDIFTKSEDRNRRNLDVEQTLKINGKCATPLIHYALKHRELLWPENRFILYRPDNPSFSRYYSPDRLLDLTYNTPEGHFKIHYTESVDNAVFNSDGDPSTIPDYVIQYGSYFEDSWDYETNILGYNPPHSDGTNGGDNRFDVYIMDITYYGYTSIENGHPYTVVDNDYSSCQTNFDPEGSRIGSMKVTAAHELFHAIQFFYDDWCDGCLWWEENTALWMEDEVFDYVDDYLRYLKDKLLNMELPMDDERYMSSKYGGVIWAKFLSETYGKDIIRDIFERLSTNNSPAKYAIEYTLLYDYYSNWGEAMTRFCLKNLTL